MTLDVNIIKLKVSQCMYVPLVDKGLMIYNAFIYGWDACVCHML